jgi:hypothetical protein
MPGVPLGGLLFFVAASPRPRHCRAYEREQLSYSLWLLSVATLCGVDLPQLPPQRPLPPLQCVSLLAHPPVEVLLGQGGGVVHDQRKVACMIKGRCMSGIMGKLCARVVLTLLSTVWVGHIDTAVMRNFALCRSNSKK